MRRLILKPFLLSISLVMAIIISGLPVNAAGPIGSETTSVASSSDTYNGVTVTAQPTPNNYKIQFLGSDSNIIIGNGTNSFTPSFTINRWGETSFTLSLASPMMGDLGNGTLSTDQSIAQNNTVSFSNSDFSIKYNPVDNTTGMNELGGLDFSFMMKAMPVSNSLLFNYTQNSVSAYFQPPLTQEYTVGTQPEGNVISKVTDTDVYDGSDQVIVHRPDYAVNSIAFYADGKQGDYTALGGKNYKTGKIGQLYRMKAVDSKGNWTWANWGLSGSTINLTVDQNWLNNATYPIMIEPVGDTFGWTSIGLSDDGIALHAWFSDSGDIWSEIRAGYNAAPVAAGNLSSISAYLGSYSGGESCNVKVLLNKNSDGSQVAIKENTGCSASYGWKTFTCNNEPIQAITYRIDIVGDAGSLTAPPTSMYAIKLDSTYPVSNAEYYYSYSSPPNSFYSGPQNPWTTYATSYGRFSIYATYAPKNLCLAITSDFSFNDAQAFANVLTQYGGWNQSALSSLLQNGIGRNCKQNSPLLQRKFPTIANKLLKALDPNNIFPIADFIGRLATSSATDISSDSAIRSGISKEGFIAALMSMRDS